MIAKATAVEISILGTQCHGQSNGCPIHYEVEGPTTDALMLCNSLGTTLHMWTQIRADAAFRVLRYDRRGMANRRAGGLTTWRCSSRRLAVLDAPSGEDALCGLSMGAWSACGSAPTRHNASTE